MRAHQQDNSLISRTNKNGQNKPGLKTQKISLWYSPPGLPLSEKKKKVQILYVLYDHFFTHSKFRKLFALQVHVHGENQTFNDRNWAEGAAVQQQLLSEPPSKDTPVSVSSIFGYRAVQSRTPRVVFIILLHFSVSYLLKCVNNFFVCLFYML